MKTQFATYVVIGINLCDNRLSYVLGCGAFGVMLNQKLWLGL